MTRPARLLGAGQAALGAALLARPDAVTHAVCASAARPRTAIVRLLGGRMVVQGAVTAARPHRRLVLAGAAIDLAHAASMVAAIRVAPPYGRAALASAATATAFALAAVAVAA